MTDVNPDNSNETYRGAHRRIDEAAAPEAAPSAALSAGAFPKRGLAMILIAVAALLLLWGIYALTQTSPAGDTAASQTSTESSASPASPTSPASGAPSSPAPDTPVAEDHPGDSADPNADPNAHPAPGSPGAPGAPGAPALNRQSANVLVFNNSPVPALASTTAQRLSEDYTVGNLSADATRMNMPEEQFGAFPETLVFFDPAVPGAEQIAGDIAHRVGGVARSVREVPQGASLPEEAARGGNAITVVLAG